MCIHYAVYMEAIGLVGGLGSGKDSFGKFIQDRKGGTLVTTSDVARRYIEDNELGEPTRDLTRTIATQLRLQNGTDYLLRQSIDHLPNDELAIVSGLYVVEEVMTLRAQRRSVIVHVDASDEVRVDRVTGRARSSDEKDAHNFHRLDGEDMRGSSTDQRLADVITMADIRVGGNVPIANTAYWDQQMQRVFQVND